MSATALPKLKCGQTLNDFAHLLKKDDKSILKCRHCEMIGNEPKRLPCGHVVCVRCIQRGRRLVMIVCCPDEKCCTAHLDEHVAEDSQRAAVLKQVIHEINQKSKKIM